MQTPMQVLKYIRGRGCMNRECLSLFLEDKSREFKEEVL